MKPINLTLAAGEELPIAAVGDAVSFISGGGAIEVKTDAGQGSAYLEPGDSFRLTRGEFANITIKNVATLGNTVKILAGFVEYVTAKLAGTVSAAITDFPDHASLDKAHYQGEATAGAFASNYSALQIWNPTGSGKLLVVRQITAELTAAANIWVREQTAAYASYADALHNKYLGLGFGSSSASLRSDVNAIGTPGNKKWLRPAQANTRYELIKHAPLIVPEGFAVGLDAGDTLNTGIKAEFVWEEISI